MLYPPSEPGAHDAVEVARFRPAVHPYSRLPWRRLYPPPTDEPGHAFQRVPVDAHLLTATLVEIPTNLVALGLNDFTVWERAGEPGFPLPGLRLRPVDGRRVTNREHNRVGIKFEIEF